MGQTKRVAAGGATGAVAASAHAGCQRFRATDPLITGLTRRKLATALGQSDIGGQISQSRWIRAAMFEKLVHDSVFASRIVTTAAGAIGMAKPSSVASLSGGTDYLMTLEAIQKAVKATSENVASIVYRAAVPLPGFDVATATPVLPDFVIILPPLSHGQKPLLVVGDAKDYERVRSRIDDGRLLKGFLQVAFGAEAFLKWTELDDVVEVSLQGVLAVPRNAYLQPTVVKEDLTDHLSEVRHRLSQRIQDTQNFEWNGDPVEFVKHLKATYDPVACMSCALFAHCRSELRADDSPDAFLQEIGIPRGSRPFVRGLLEASKKASDRAPLRMANQVLASLTGVPFLTGQLRTDPVGLAGTIFVVTAKSDAAALGVYGVSIRYVSQRGMSDWKTTVFRQPQKDSARHEMMDALGSAIQSIWADGMEAERDPIYVVAPDKETSDLFATVADTLAGTELSRIRWERDIEQGREPLTFDGRHALVPEALSERERLGVSFMLEDDRGRALKSRLTTIDLRSVLSNYITIGGTEASNGRLDIINGWLAASTDSAVNFRELIDLVDARDSTPGARLKPVQSDKIQQAFVDFDERASKFAAYEEVVSNELAYKAEQVDMACEWLASLQVSKLRGALLEAESKSQKMWRRRYDFHAYDLVRFGRTLEWVRNELVALVDVDKKVMDQLRVVVSPVWADEQAKAAGTRYVAIATVAEVNPLKLEIRSRQFTEGTKVVLLHHNARPLCEDADVKPVAYAKHVKLSGMTKGVLARSQDDHSESTFECVGASYSGLEVGDQLVVADLDQFEDPGVRLELKIPSLPVDKWMAPKDDCTPDSYQIDPANHKYCCQPHEIREVESSDYFATRRAAGLMNPEVWPPVLDADGFSQLGQGEPTEADFDATSEPAPDSLTLDDLD